MNENDFLTIETIFEKQSKHHTHKLYLQSIKECINNILSEDFLSTKTGDDESLADLKDQFISQLPIVTTIPCQENWQNLSFYMLCRFRPNAYKFFFEMFSM